MRATAAERLFPLFREHFSPASTPETLSAASGKSTTAARPPAPPQTREEKGGTNAGIPALPPQRCQAEEDEEVTYVWRDLFLVKYAADGGQVAVGLHRDGSSLR